ncbi:MAG: hypothetical protein OXG33_01530 [Chloroflexi bacterium]|nr:hypothetical protein [Chloroflexota bacterium]
MRDAASRGFWVAGRVPYGCDKILVQDGANRRPKLQPNSPTSPMVRRIVAIAASGRSALDITATLNAEGIANPTGRL